MLKMLLKKTNFEKSISLKVTDSDDKRSYILILKKKKQIRLYS